MTATTTVRAMAPMSVYPDADLDTTGMVDYKLMRREAKSAVKTVLQLSSTSAADLAAPTS